MLVPPKKQSREKTFAFSQLFDNYFL
jgi:hypothetical protein